MSWSAAAVGDEEQWAFPVCAHCLGDSREGVQWKGTTRVPKRKGNEKKGEKKGGKGKEKGKKGKKAQLWRVISAP